jgi:hypothetical protein
VVAATHRTAYSMSKITFLTRFSLKKDVYTEGSLFEFFILAHKKALDGQSNVAFKANSEEGFKIETP